jgi:hypothetical protein
MYLVFDVGGPEPINRAVVRVRGKDRHSAAGGGWESLVDVLHDNLRVADGLAVMDEHGHLLEHGVGLEEKLTLVKEVLLGVRVGEAFQVQRDARSDHERARPQAQQRKPFATTGGFSCHAS